MRNLCCKTTLCHLSLMVQNDIRVHKRLMELPNMGVNKNPYGDGYVSALEMVSQKIDMLIAQDAIQFGEENLD